MLTSTPSGFKAVCKSMSAGMSATSPYFVPCCSFTALSTIAEFALAWSRAIEYILSSFILPKLFLITLSRVSSCSSCARTSLLPSGSPPLGMYTYLTVWCGVVMTVAACVWFSSCSRSSSSLIEVFSKVVSSTSPEALFSSALLIDCSIALDSGCVLFSAGLEQPAILNAVNSATSAICALLKIDFFPLLPLLPVNETESVPP